MRFLRFSIAAAIPAVAVFAALAPGQAGAASLGPSALGWWDATEQPGGPAVPAPDVPGGGGLIAGATTAAGSRTTAVTAIRFTIPAGTSASDLTLPLASSNAPGVAPLACLTTATWGPGYQQAGSGPSYDCTHSSLPTVTGSSLVFSDIGQLQRGTSLDVVLVPSSAGRIVLNPPPSNALQTIGVPSTPQTPVFTAPAAGPGTTTDTPPSTPSSAKTARPKQPVRQQQPPPTSGNDGHPVVASARPASAIAAATGAAAPQGATSGTSVAVSPVPLPSPVGSGIAAPEAPTPANQVPQLLPQLATSANRSALQTPLKNHRLALTLALIFLLVLAAVLFVLDPESRTGRVGAALAALRGVPVETVVTSEVRGIGRHRSERAGKPPAF